MLKLKTLSGRATSALLILIGLVAGLAISQFNRPNQPVHSALDSYNNQVIEMSSAATKDNPIYVYSEPVTGSQVDRLLWGDRVLWRGVEQTGSDGNRWIYVSLSEGVSGWIAANLTDISSGKMFLSGATYTTPGIEVGGAVSVTADGAGSNLRNAPSVSGERIRATTANEVLTVIGGPYQNELYVWWQYRDASGTEGWMVDIAGWLTPQAASSSQPAATATTAVATATTAPASNGSSEEAQ